MCAQTAEVLLDAFFERKHQPGETISTFAKALKELLTQAEPTLPEAKLFYYDSLQNHFHHTCKRK
jgi:hypothetical protein